MSNMDTQNISFSDADNWETVRRKTKSPKSAKTKVQLPHIPFDELCRTLREVLSKYSDLIVAGFVYGSRARETNRPNSDADLLIFWKNPIHLDDLKMIRAEVESALGIETDFVSCIRTKKYIAKPDQRDDAYFGNVMLDARRFMGTEYLEDLVPYSVKLKKLGR